MSRRKIARGEVRRILTIVGEIQDKIGLAESLHYNDRSQTAFEDAQKLLREAFQLCIEVVDSYKPIIK